MAAWTLGELWLLEGASTGVTVASVVLAGVVGFLLVAGMAGSVRIVARSRPSERS